MKGTCKHGNSGIFKHSAKAAAGVMFASLPFKIQTEQ